MTARAILPPADADVMAALIEAEAPLCARCEASFRRPLDTLCAECRAEIDLVYADLPGAEP